MQQKKPSSLGFGGAGPYMGLGIEFTATVILCFLLGRWIDGKLDSEPYLTLIGFLLGTGAAMLNLIRSVDRIQKSTEKRDESSQSE